MACPRALDRAGSLAARLASDSGLASESTVNRLAWPPSHLLLPTSSNLSPISHAVVPVSLLARTFASSSNTMHFLCLVRDL